MGLRPVTVFVAKGLGRLGQLNTENDQKLDRTESRREHQSGDCGNLRVNTGMEPAQDQLAGPTEGQAG